MPGLCTAAEQSAGSRLFVRQFHGSSGRVARLRPEQRSSGDGGRKATCGNGWSVACWPQSVQPSVRRGCSPSLCWRRRAPATASGCSAALEYLNAHAAPGFAFECPGDAQGHQAMTTCVSGASACSIQRLIVIADPCPAAYMNEASNSWDLIGASCSSRPLRVLQLKQHGPKPK